MQLFYAPDVDFSTGRYLLSGEESRHCARVLRLRSGDFVHIAGPRSFPFRRTAASCRSASASKISKSAVIFCK